MSISNLSYILKEKKEEKLMLQRLDKCNIMHNGCKPAVTTFLLVTCGSQKNFKTCSSSNHYSKLPFRPIIG